MNASLQIILANVNTNHPSSTPFKFDGIPWSAGVWTTEVHASFDIEDIFAKSFVGYSCLDHNHLWLKRRQMRACQA